jgi:ferredoxin
MSWEINREKCLRCGACVSVCPVLALELKESGIVHDQKRCTLCRSCERVCPVGSVRVKK